MNSLARDQKLHLKGKAPHQELSPIKTASWDPLCFSSIEGLLYYLPAMIRLTLDNIEDRQNSYLDQFLFHLIQDGRENRLVLACSREQRNFIAAFLEYLINNYTSQIEAEAHLPDEVLRAHEIWCAV